VRRSTRRGTHNKNLLRVNMEDANSVYGVDIPPQYEDGEQEIEQHMHLDHNLARLEHEIFGRRELEELRKRIEFLEKQNNTLKSFNEKNPNHHERIRNRPERSYGSRANHYYESNPNHLERFPKPHERIPNPNERNSNHNSVESNEESDARSVFVGNVDYSCTPEDLSALFARCGALDRVTIKVDKFGNPKGHAFVKFVHPQSVEKALQLYDTEVNGRKIKVIRKRTNIPGMKNNNRVSSNKFNRATKRMPHPRHHVNGNGLFEDQRQNVHKQRPDVNPYRLVEDQLGLFRDPAPSSFNGKPTVLPPSNSYCHSHSHGMPNGYAKPLRRFSPY